MKSNLGLKIITYINELLEDISHGKLNVVGLEED
jgi:hypothetical protein